MIFISHVSQDNAWAIALREWLGREGWNDVFVDLTPSPGVADAYRWLRAFVTAIDRCEAVLFLVSNAWLQSEHAKDAFESACSLKKNLCLVFVEQIPLEKLPSTSNAIVFNLVGDPSEEFLLITPSANKEVSISISQSSLQLLRTWLETKAGENNLSSQIIFVSFSTQDRKEALVIVEDIEAAGLRCWISCRDVPRGEDFQDAIVAALEQSKAMVLVFSRNANNSSEIKKEVALASENRLFVLPIRIENVEPTKGFKYQLATRQYVDLFDERERNMGLIVDSLRKHLSALRAATHNSGI